MPRLHAVFFLGHSGEPEADNRGWLPLPDSPVGLRYIRLGNDGTFECASWLDHSEEGGIGTYDWQVLVLQRGASGAMSGLDVGLRQCDISFSRHRLHADAESRHSDLYFAGSCGAQVGKSVIRLLLLRLPHHSRDLYYRSDIARVECWRTQLLVGCHDHGSFANWADTILSTGMQIQRHRRTVRVGTHRFSSASLRIPRDGVAKAFGGGRHGQAL
mmetsp:Transcript_22202/g.52299  ORF Transcript_22202/g.52299 Transcript_22202/m.52299 type:complete len:215 (-) Transcript_22202:337-981(-)